MSIGDSIQHLVDWFLTQGWVGVGWLFAIALFALREWEKAKLYDRLVGMITSSTIANNTVAGALTALSKNLDENSEVEELKKPILDILTTVSRLDGRHR